MREEGLPLYRQRVRAALDDLINPVIIVRPDTAGGGEVQEFVVVYANRAATRMGTTPGTVWTRHDQDVPRDLFRRCVTALRRGAVVEEADLPVADPSGGERTIDLRATRLGRELLVTWRDVTDRHRSELALAASEARYRGIIDSLADASAVLAPVLDETGELVDLVLQDVNPAALEWGVVPGISVCDLHQEDGSPWLFDAYADTWRHGRPLAVDALRFTFPDGSPRFMDLRAVRVGDLVFATWRDVTARHLAEQSLLESERRFRLAFDGAPIGTLLLDLSDGLTCRVRDVNRSMTDLLGVAAEDLVGADLLELVHPEDRGSPEAQLPRLLAGERPEHRRTSTKRLRRADGAYVWVRVTASTLREDDGVVDVIAHVEDVTAQRAAEDELARRALYDSLTGLANRTLLLDHLSLALHELGREPGVLAVMFLDLDRFKDVNDSLGHGAGDDVLREVGARLRAAVRAPDTAARMAGDEFVVVARVGNDLDAVHLAERLHDALAGPVELAGPGGARSVVVLPSVGLTTTSSPAASPEVLLREADLAMYQAKRQTRVRWAVYDEELHSQALERLAVEEALREAVAHDRLRLLYQPIVDVASGRVVAAEALLRVADPERGLLTPDRFIDVAEDSDLIVPIGGWVLAEACRCLSRWREHAPDLTVAVNVSARQVVRLALHDQVTDALRETGVDPRSLEVEITERVLLDADGPAVADLLCVTDDGSRLAIDDFGTGYSSLAYLKRFPVSVVKIDRSFVQGLGVRPDDTAIVEAIVGLARTLGLTTVAEGVETQEQLDALRELGCDRAQGYLFGRPVPAEELGARVRQEAGVGA